MTGITKGKPPKMRSGKCSRNGIRSAVSGGAALPVAFATATASVGAMVQGAAIGMNAIDNLKNDKGRVNASFTENTGRGSNHLKPDPKAQGDHSTFRTDLKTGKTTNTATYKENQKNPSEFQETKRVDITGNQHGGVPTPHVKEPGTKRYVQQEKMKSLINERHGKY